MKFINTIFSGILFDLVDGRLQVWTDLLAEGWVERCLEALEKIQTPGEEVVLPMVTGCDMGVGDIDVLRLVETGPKCMGFRWFQNLCWKVMHDPRSCHVAHDMP